MLAHRLCTDFQYFSSIHNKMIHLFAFLVQYHTIQKLLLFIKDALLTSLRPVPLKNRKSMSSPAPQKLTKPVGCNEAKLIANTGGNYRKFSFRGGKMRKSISFKTFVQLLIILLASCRKINLNVMFSLIIR